MLLELLGYQKTIATIRMLAYGVTVDLLYEYFRMGEITTIKSLKRLLKQRFQYFLKSI